MDKVFLTNEECALAARKMCRATELNGLAVKGIYGVPRGGIPVAYLATAYRLGARVVDFPMLADIIVDDIVASGATKRRHNEKFPGVPFMALCDFLDPARIKDKWVVFPWEQGDKDTSADDIIIRLLQYIGEDSNRGGLKETPQRVLRAWKEWTAGYGQDVASVLKCFEDGGENYNEMVTVKDLPFYSHCEHHLAPFFGTVTVAYLPDKKVVGLSKLGRIVNIFARRLQVQERLTTQIAKALSDHLQPQGVGVLIKARHLCMESRGLSSQGHCTITSALEGKFLDAKVRSEFLSIAQ